MGLRRHGGVGSERDAKAGHRHNCRNCDNGATLTQCEGRESAPVLHHRDAGDHRHYRGMRRGRLSGWAAGGLPPRQVHYVGRCECDPAVRVPFAAAQSAASRMHARCVGGRGQVWGCGVGGVDHALRLNN